MTSEERKPFVLVIMPFKDKFDDIYRVGIKPACETAGALCERIDEQIFVGDILSRVYKQIVDADIIVADLSERNPNVYYETGYAHALRKPVILVTQQSKEIPFNLQHFQHVVYGSSIAKLKQELEARIRWFLEHPEQADPTDHGEIPKFIGRWRSTWIIDEGGQGDEKTEIIHIQKQRGRYLYGEVVSEESDMDHCSCDLEGTYVEGYLQLRWSPSEVNGDLIDYGCYFLRRQPDGSFKGYAVGHFWNLGRIGTYEQTVRRIKD